MTIDASRFDQLAGAVDAMSNEELLSAVQAQEGGVDRVLDQVFQGMVNSFNPAKAGSTQAVVQYDIGVPDGTRSYTMRVADGRCEVDRGPAESPRVTIRLGFGDFLRLVTGKLNGMQAFMAGRLKVAGDLFFAQTMQGWFDRPSA